MADPNNDILEPEERTGATPAATVMEDQDILTGEPVHERGHASVSATGPTVGEWAPPAYQPGMNNDEETDDGKKAEPEASDFVNPDMMDLPEGDKLEGATYMADMAIEIYGEGKKELGNLLIPIKNRRLRRLEEKGLIDQDIMLPRRDGGYAPAADFIESYNRKATDVFGVRPKFREEVRPILIKEFAKKGIGLTPWQRIGFAVFMDLKEDVKIAMGLRAMGEEIIETMKEMTEAVRQSGRGGVVQQTTVVTAAPAAEPAPAQPAQQPAPVFDPSNPDHAFDHIQARGGTIVTPPPQPSRQTAGGATLSVKRPRKRGPYKKKKKPHAVTVIEVKPNN